MQGDQGRRIATGLLAAALGVVLAVPVFAGDADIQKRIEGRLAKAGLDHSTNVAVHVDEGVVHLTGLAVSLEDARAVEKAARREAKVVINQIRVVPDRERTDRAIRNDVEYAVTSYPRYGPFDAVGVEVDDGLVRLVGFVLDDVRRRDLEDRVARVEGVRDVHNDLRLQGFSPGDVRLRWEVYQRLYSDPMFERYASWSDPPIRVLVDRGRVTLAGTVGTPLEQVVAGHIARGTLAFQVNNLVQIEGDKARDEDRKRSDS
jgi:osmotically-inducible protein OsmY